MAPENKKLKAKRKRIVTVPPNDGLNTPVPGTAAQPVRSADEEALYRQADNPLGDPHKI
ncbi:MAG: hypothetical protein ABJC12_14340 [Saprospiraceae bacterium]